MTEAYNEFSILSRKIGSYLADLIDLLDIKRANMTPEELHIVTDDLVWLSNLLKVSIDKGTE